MRLTKQTGSCLGSDHSSPEAHVVLSGLLTDREDERGGTTSMIYNMISYPKVLCVLDVWFRSPYTTVESLLRRWIHKHTHTHMYARTQYVRTRTHKCMYAHTHTPTRAHPHTRTPMHTRSQAQSTQPQRNVPACSSSGNSWGEEEAGGGGGRRGEGGSSQVNIGSTAGLRWGQCCAQMVLKCFDSTNS